jgi:hypothetical protein
MKTAYELAMDRLSQSAPASKISAKQKKDLAELDSQFAAKIATREIHLKGQIAAAHGAGDAAAAEALEQQLAAERRDLATDLEAKKEKIRKPSKSA